MRSSYQIPIPWASIGSSRRGDLLIRVWRWVVDEWGVLSGPGMVSTLALNVSYSASHSTTHFPGLDRKRTRSSRRIEGPSWAAKARVTSAYAVLRGVESRSASLAVVVWGAESKEDSAVALGADEATVWRQSVFLFLERVQKDNPVVSRLSGE